MKILRIVLIAFMVFVSIFHAIELSRAVMEATRGFNRLEAYTPKIAAVVGRFLGCVLYAWFAIALWKKNRLSVNAS